MLLYNFHICMVSSVNILNWHDELDFVWNQSFFYNQDNCVVSAVHEPPLICLLRLCSVVNIFLQKTLSFVGLFGVLGGSLLKGFISLWTEYKWYVRFCFALKPISQWRHSKGFSFSWTTLMCFLRLDLLDNIFPQILHCWLSNSWSASIRLFGFWDKSPCEGFISL